MHWLLWRLCGQMLLPPQSCSRASFSARAPANTPPTAAAAAGGAPTLHWFLWRLCGQMLLPPQSCSQASFSAHTNANTPATATAAAGRGGAPTLQNLLSRLCSQRSFCALCSRRVACCFSQNAMQSSTLVFSTAGPWAPLSSSFESPFSGCSTPPPLLPCAWAQQAPAIVPYRRGSSLVMRVHIHLTEKTLRMPVRAGTVAQTLDLRATHL